MFGQASNRWLSPTNFLLLVAVFFAVHLTSSLRLASNVDHMPTDLDNFARMRLSQTESPQDWQQCAKQRLNNMNTTNYHCTTNMVDEKYKDVIPVCKIIFVSIECQIEDFCRLCEQFSLEKFSEERKTYYKSVLEEKCKQYDSVMPKLPISDCPELPTGHTGADDSDHSPKSGNFFSSTAGIIVVAVVVIVVIAIGGLISWCMCSSSDGGDGGGRAADKSKGNKSTKSKGGKSAKSLKAKSTKSKGGKSAKSLKAKSKGGKSIKAKSAKSKGGKSMKAKSAKG